MKIKYLGGAKIFWGQDLTIGKEYKLFRGFLNDVNFIKDDAGWNICINENRMKYFEVIE